MVKKQKLSKIIQRLEALSEKLYSIDLPIEASLLGNITHEVEVLAAADSHKPPPEVRKAAKLGLELRKKFGRGGLSTQEAGEQGIGSGIARATSLASGKGVSFNTIKRMHAYFSRHQGDKKAKGWGSKTKPSNGYIAWLLWGGDPGWAWSKKVIKEREKKTQRSDND